MFNDLDAVVLSRRWFVLFGDTIACVDAFERHFSNTQTPSNRLSVHHNAVGISREIFH